MGDDGERSGGGEGPPAFLKVDYSRYSNITSRKYADGERILVREKWDNENNAAGDNWDLATEKR